MRLQLPGKSLWLAISVLLITMLGGCFGLQQAWDCNNPGWLGCKDKAETIPKGPEAYPDLKPAPENRQTRKKKRILQAYY